MLNVRQYISIKQAHDNWFRNKVNLLIDSHIFNFLLETRVLLDIFLFRRGIASVEAFANFSEAHPKNAFSKAVVAPPLLLTRSF